MYKDFGCSSCSEPRIKVASTVLILFLSNICYCRILNFVKSNYRAMICTILRTLLLSRISSIGRNMSLLKIIGLDRFLSDDDMCTK